MRIERDQLKDLIETPARPQVSIFLPTHNKGPATRQDPIRLRNLLREAERGLERAGLAPSDTATLLETGQRLLDDAYFWQNRTDGLALFLAPGVHHRFDLPFACDELCVTADRFHVKPVIPLLYHGARVFVLALSQKRVRLVEGGSWGEREVDVPGMPHTLDEVLPEEREGRQLQFHTGTTGSAGERAAQFHGHGARADERRSLLRRYFRQVDEAVARRLGATDVPLVLAGVEYLFPIYREVTDHPGLLEEGIPGNPDELTDKELHRRARAIVEPRFERIVRARMDDFQQLAGTESQRASSDLGSIVPAAVHARVQSLFVALGVQRWGSYDAPSGRMSVRSATDRQTGDVDLLDLAASHTLINGGDVYALEPERVPGNSVAAAILRF